MIIQPTRSIIAWGKTAILTVSLLFGYIAVAQRYTASIYTVADGLANSYVLDIVQDSSGLMWFATQSGLSSYDGIGFTNYGTSDSLENSGYIYLKVDEKGGLWALPKNPHNKITFFDGKKWRFFPANNPMPNQDRNVCFDVSYINNDLVIVEVTNESGLFLYVNKKWINIGGAPIIKNELINIVKIEGSDIYLGTNNGIFVIRNFDITRIEKLNIDLPSNSVQSFAFSKDQKLWILGENWIGYQFNKKFTLVSKSLSLFRTTSSGSCFMYPATIGEVYFGNLVNLYCYSTKYNTLELLTRNSGLISDGASSVKCDRENNLWVASYRGVTKISSRSFYSYSKIDGLYDNEIASILEISPGKFVFGHHGAITFFDGKKFTSKILDKTTKVSPHEARVLDLLKDTEDNIWAAVTTLGIAKINSNHDIKWYREKAGVMGRVNSIARIGNDRIICAAQNGILEKKGEKFVNYPLNIKLDMQIRKIFPSKDDDFYLATLENGLIEVKGNTAVFINADNATNGNNVFSVHNDSRNRTWVGCLDGLYTRIGNKLVKVNENGLCINNPVYLIIEDKLHRLWFGTDNGMYRWSDGKLYHFTVRNGLAGLDINRSAGIIDEKDHLWVGTNNGLTLYRPEYDYGISNIPAPKVSVLNIEAGNNVFKPTDKINLKNYDNDVIFHFRALSFIDERHMVYKYKLDGLDNEWSAEINFQSDHVRISNLSPGKYQFFIKVRNIYGVWSEPASSSIIIIEEPFWNEWWFISIVILAVLSGLYMTGRFVFITRTKKNLERLVAVRTRELSLSEERLRNINNSKDTFFTVISHDLRSPYNSLMGMIDILITEYSMLSDEERLSILKSLKGTTDRSYALLENLLTWAKAQKGMIPYKPEVFIISEVIDDNIYILNANLDKKGISLEYNAQKKFTVFADKNMISTVIRNLLSNAIKFSYPGSVIAINIEENNSKNIVVSIIDQGGGIPLNIKENLFKIDNRISTKGTSDEPGTGMGLILCKEFIEMNNGEISVISEVDKGSTFSFALPVTYGV